MEGKSCTLVNCRVTVKHNRWTKYWNYC